MFQNILVPLDASQESRTILRWAVQLAKSTDAELTLLSVVDRDDIEIIEATLRGGVSHRVELLAKCPVLTVK